MTSVKSTDKRLDRAHAALAYQARPNGNSKLVEDKFTPGRASSKPQGMADNTVFFQTIVQSQRLGQSCLPYRLGLSDTDYEAFKVRYGDLAIDPADHWDALPADDLRQELLMLRWQEAVDIVGLLVADCSGKDSSELWMAKIVAAGCLGGDHLWRDLGLRDRDSLSALLDLNFPALAACNSGDMKWKKFFYKQLCEQSGNYVCRAPSCQQCATYAVCFGPEN